MFAEHQSTSESKVNQLTNESMVVLLHFWNVEITVGLGILDLGFGNLNLGFCADVGVPCKQDG